MPHSRERFIAGLNRPVISRRDFLNGSLIASSSLALGQSASFPVLGKEVAGTETGVCGDAIGNDPRAIRGGNSSSTFNVGHWMRDRRLSFEQDAVTLASGCDGKEGKFQVLNDDEDVDVIVLGGGLAGLSAAFYLLRRSPGLKILLLEANPYAGGNASCDDQPQLPVPASTAGAYCTTPYTYFLREVYKKTGVDWNKHIIEHPIDSYYFDEHAPGAPDLSSPRYDCLSQMSFASYLTDVLHCDPIVAEFYTCYTVDCLGGTSHNVNAHTAISFLSSDYIAGKFFAYPGGTTEIATRLTHWLIKPDKGNRPTGSFKMQLQAVALRVDFDAQSSKSKARVTYFKDNKFRRATGKAMVVATPAHSLAASHRWRKKSGLGRIQHRAGARRQCRDTEHDSVCRAGLGVQQ